MDTDFMLSRAEERNTLRDLNSRFQEYISRVKELEDECFKVNKESDTMKLTLTNEITRLKQDNSKKLEQVNVQCKTISELEVNWGNAKQENEKFSKEIQTLTERKETNQIEILSLREKIEDLNAKYKEEVEKNSDLKDDKESSTLKINELASKLSNTEVELDNVIQKCDDFKEEVSNKTKQLEELEKSKRQDLESLSNDWAIRHNSACTQWQNELDRKIHALEKQYQTQIESEVVTVRERNEELSMELENATRLLHEEITKHQNTLKEMEAKLSLLADRYRQTNTQWETKVVDLEKKLASTRGQLNDSEKRFAELMDIKISLDVELKQMMEAFSHEEERLYKKRKLTDVYGSDEMALLQHREGITLAELNIPDGYIIVKNPTKKTISLKDYQIKSSIGNQAYNFPDNFSLKSGSTVTLWSGKGNRRKRSINNDSHLWWTTRDTWNRLGDSAILVDGSGDKICTLRSRPTKFDARVAENLSKEHADKDGQGCKMM